jgi:taurine dioxygenase
MPNTTEPVTERRQSAARRIDPKPLGGGIGAEIRGFDGSAPMDAAEFAVLKTAFLDHKVLILRAQDFSPASFLAFSKLWGDTHIYPYMTGLEEEPEVFEIEAKPDAKRFFGNRWHADQMYAKKPVKVTLLYAKVLPPVGGDTIFSNLELAYEALSNGMKAMLSGLRIYCDGADKSRYGGKSREEWYATEGTAKTYEDESKSEMIAIHPLVRTHPETGRKCLFLGDQAQRFDGLTAEESAPLLDFLMNHIQRPEFTCRVRWEPGSMVMWDNRCVCHYAVADYAGQLRRMHRVTIAGDTPV